MGLRDVAVAEDGLLIAWALHVYIAVHSYSSLCIYIYVAVYIDNGVKARAKKRK